jgi:hypothetical protein
MEEKREYPNLSIYVWNLFRLLFILWRLLRAVRKIVVYGVTCFTGRCTTFFRVRWSKPLMRMYRRAMLYPFEIVIRSSYVDRVY